MWSSFWVAVEFDVRVQERVRLLGNVEYSATVFVEGEAPSENLFI